ncbi:outer membrane beta-barrel protein [Rudanella paleaurantiibacter]|uniref:Outer membrane beta-barrel protein n=2 Tax=Rudanella paleaurantiibacter TaxID=2614655 RepID=A0A7J5U1E3_9BACT|nr:outer membrane beta-barrel protein [Rudanella paleaurantiibacter]
MSSPTNNANTTGTMSGTESMGTGTTSNGTYSSGSTGNTTGTGAMNSAPTYNATTTTTTTTSDYGTTPTRTRDANGNRAWGKDGKFGVYAGLNFSRFVNEPIPDDAYRTGWQAGIYGRSGGTIFGQIGLEYRNSTSNLVRSGSAIGNPTSGTAASGAETRGKIDQHFLAIPAYVGARIGALAGLRLQAGLELSSLVSIGNNAFNLDRADLNRTILNGLLGAGINLGPVTLDAVYNHGLQNVFDDADTKRRMWAFNVGFRF